MAELSMHVEAIELLIGIFGAFDENMKVLEKELDVTVVNRESELEDLGRGSGECGAGAPHHPVAGQPCRAR